MISEYETLNELDNSRRQTELINALIEHDNVRIAAESIGVNERSAFKMLARIRERRDNPEANQMDIIVIADTQIDQFSPIDHLHALSKYIWEHKPKHIIHIGDHWDFPSLSSYASVSDSEGRRLVDDIDSGVDAFKAIMAYTDTMNAKGKHKPYNPNKHFLMGNHENRLNRYLESNPVLKGMIDLRTIVEQEGWTFRKMCQPLWLHDICFNHYMENSMSGRPVGGAIENKLNKFPHSFCHGHQQQFQFGRRQNLIGKPHIGVCAGSFYMHDEAYRGANNTEIRGFTHWKAFTNRYGFIDHDVEFISLERLLQKYPNNQKEQE